jgi:hypothetical protein
MATIIILPFKAKNSITANDNHTTGTAVTAHIHKYISHKVQNFLTAIYDHPPNQPAKKNNQFRLLYE